MTQAVEAKRKEFLDMLPEAARHSALAWCPKYRKCVDTLHLRYLRCWDCKRYVVNGGGCVPF